MPHGEEQRALDCSCIKSPDDRMWPEPSDANHDVLDPKKGSACHRMLDCGHVFCVECLRDFYNNAIKEGDINSVRCLAPNCAKEREKAVGSLAAGRRRKAPRALFISPSELLQIPLEQDVVKRYVALKYKTELESDKNTIYCPRSWCNGAARSRKHKKPEGLQLSEQVSDDEGQSGSDREGEENAEGGEKAQTKPKVFQPSEELLAICEDCGFAFCSRCYQSWHGEFYRCRPRNSTEECPEDEKASLEYIKLHTTPCPTCAAPAQKTHGCNHMICYRCQTHFCYLCSTWLNPSNPYQHFNEAPGGKVTGCYQRLWELEEGDGNDVGIGFAGGRAQQPAVRQLALNVAPPVAVIEEWEEIDDEDEVAGGDDREARQRQDAAVENGGQIGVAREGPLVLRIAGGNPAARRGGPRGRGAPEERRPQQPNHPDMYEQGGGRGRGRGRGRAGRARAGRRGGGEEGPGRRGANRGVGVGDGGMAMDPAHEAWIRHFVRLALNDEEDLIMDMPDDLDAAQFPGGHFVMDDEEDGEL